MITMLESRPSIFGSSGIRRPFSRDLMDLATDLGLACGDQYRTVVIGRDTRTSSQLLRDALVSGLLAAGARVMDAGMVTTPTLALAARQGDLGIMITASHNPPEYNGFKPINPDGSGISPVQQRQLQTAMDSGNLRPAKWSRLRETEVYPSAAAVHRQTILENCFLERKVRVVVDSCCGAASLTTPPVLEALGCEVIPLNCSPGGVPPRGAEPVAANLTELMTAVKETGADLGLAHDIDADRVMAVDDTGRFIPGDSLLVILARGAGVRNVVTTLDASMAIEDAGFVVMRTRIGDAFVSWELTHGRGEFGGEPSGSWIFPEVSLCPDGIYTAARLAALASRRKLSVLADEIDEYPIVRGSIEDPGIELCRLERELLDAWSPLEVSRMDGLKFIFEDSWVLIRKSGTEPKIRVTVEARDEARLRELYDRVMAALSR